MLQALLLVAVLLILGRLVSQRNWRRAEGENPWRAPPASDAVTQEKLIAEVAALRSRVETLERIVVAPDARLRSEIDALKPLPEEKPGGDA